MNYPLQRPFACELASGGHRHPEFDAFGFDRHQRQLSRQRVEQRRRRQQIRQPDLMRRNALLEEGRNSVAVELVDGAWRTIKAGAVNDQQMLARGDVVQQRHARGAAVEHADVARQAMA